MCSAPNHRNGFRKIVVAGIAICVEISTESLQKFLGMGSTSAWLILIHDNGRVCIAAGPIKPHIALTLGLFARRMQYLQSSFISMENFSLQKLPVQLLIYWLQVNLRGVQDPIGHGLAAQRNALSFQFLLLPVNGRALDKFLSHNIGNGLRSSKVVGDNVFSLGAFTTSVSVPYLLHS